MPTRALRSSFGPHPKIDSVQNREASYENLYLFLETEGYFGANRDKLHKFFKTGSFLSDTYSSLAP